MGERRDARRCRKLARKSEMKVSKQFVRTSRPRSGRSYPCRSTCAAVRTVNSMSASVWAVEMNPASNCDGAK